MSPIPRPAHTVVPAAGIQDTPPDQVWKVAWMAASAAMAEGAGIRHQLSATEQ